MNTPTFFRFSIAALVVAALIPAPAAVAQGNGRSKGEGKRAEKNAPVSKRIPPGQAKKLENGPPGSDEWSPERQREWQEDLTAAKRSYINTQAKKNTSDADMKKGVATIDQLSRKGVPPQEALTVVNRSAENGVQGNKLDGVVNGLSNGLERFDPRDLGDSLLKRLDKVVKDIGGVVAPAKDAPKAPSKAPSSDPPPVISGPAMPSSPGGPPGAVIPIDAPIAEVRPAKDARQTREGARGKVF